MDSNDITDDKDSGPEVQINFPSSVMSRIEELMGGTEQFDNDEFDAVSYINHVFPTEQSLAGVESAVARCEFRLAGVELDIRRLVRAQPQQREEGQKALLHAQQCIAELALQVADINKKAERSESMVREITSEIKQLDCAKSNLTAAITALNHLHMLVGGVDSLNAMTNARQYKEVVLPMQAIMEVLQHFSCYDEIEPLNALREQVHHTRSQLAQQILDDFKQAFTGSKSAVPARTLREASAAVDGLEPRVRRQLLGWLVALQLQEYAHLFSPEQEVAWVSHIEKRFTWLKKHLLAFEDSLGNMFPPHWKVSEKIAMQFCKTTREELGALLAARRGELDVKLLLPAIQKTAAFEALLHKRFSAADESGTDIDVSLDPAADNKNFDIEGKEPESALAQSPWRGAIGACFEPYLSLYITSLDHSLRTFMDHLQEPPPAEGGAVGGAGGGGVLSSCADLFLFYKRCLVQCARLSTAEPMLELSGVFAKYLREYSVSVLSASLPRATPSTSLVGNLQTLLKEYDNHPRYTPQELGKITSVITTAEYCLETTLHLQQKLKEKVVPRLKDKIDLTPEQDLFQALIADCIQLLVRDVEAGCAAALGAMARAGWQHVRAVADQSGYVGHIAQLLRHTVPLLRDNLASSRKYFTQFCIRFANSFIPKFIQNIYKCKPISTAGTEQLLLDTHMLKTVLLEMPSVGSEVKRPPPATYTKVVIKLMTRAEMVLKLVMAPLEGAGDGFVAQFQQLLPDGTLQEFRKVLDMKGVKMSKTQVQALELLFKEAAKTANTDGK
ncbi:vacuolar protein sorting-associated protein 53 homolog isoform X2 [Amyelois transitella]|uniref:vacuolar protein sorting-associated protein 53 homolog isoform X2 n=1 Tax=Amyelois transitella TaxID=680683 RepID=UPI00298FCC03|nr:vacuolar protein sorting-associated protein 53 homolog isoform X2 [Amyelois transitella]